MAEQGILEQFFSRSFENNINKEMLNYDYVFPYKEVQEYITMLIQVPIYYFIEYIRSKVYLESSSKEIPQYSSLKDATNRYCQVLADNGDKGFKFDEVGRLLLNDGVIRLIGAYRKYGENHSKTACQLGLIQNIYNNFFLSSLGKVFNTLHDEQKTALLARTALRNPFYAKIFSMVKFNDVNIALLCQSLSTSTIRRRRSNVMKICNIIIEQCHKENFELEHSILFIID